MRNSILIVAALTISCGIMSLTAQNGQITGGGGGSSSKGGGGTANIYGYVRALCQNTISGTNAQLTAVNSGTLAATTNCNHTGVLGLMSFPSGSTTQIPFTISLPSTWKDPIAFTIMDGETSATSGNVAWAIYGQCAGNGTAWVTSSYSLLGTFTTFAVPGTAYLPFLSSTTLSITTGCTALQTFYGYIQNSANTTGQAIGFATLQYKLTE